MPKSLEEIEADVVGATLEIFGGVPLSREKLAADVRKKLEGRWKKIAQDFVFTGDGLYTCPTRAELEALLKASLKSLPKYLNQTMDCDDYSWRLKVLANEQARKDGKTASYALGIIWRTDSTRARTGHAYNWAVLADNTLVMIEPQDGTYRALGEEDRSIDLVCC